MLTWNHALRTMNPTLASRSHCGSWCFCLFSECRLLLIHGIAGPNVQVPWKWFVLLLLQLIQCLMPFILQRKDSQRGLSHTASLDKEGRKLEIWDHKVYVSSTLSSNHEAIMGRYQLFLWENIGSYLQFIPDKKTRLAKEFQGGVIWPSKQQNNVVPHVVDCTAKYRFCSHMG